jgi:alpha-tubulin suppressor-like RCC1 family protein
MTRNIPNVVTEFFRCRSFVRQSDYRGHCPLGGARMTLSISLERRGFKRVLGGSARVAFLTLVTCILGLLGCSRSIDDAPCPCAEGWICCEATNTCVGSKKECSDDGGSTLISGASGNGTGGNHQSSTRNASETGGANHNSGFGGSGTDGSKRSESVGGGSSNGFSEKCVGPWNVTATTDLPFVRVTWDNPQGGVPIGFVIERDNVEIAQVNASVNHFTDPLSANGVGAPTGLEATQKTLPGIVRLTWRAPTVVATTHRYTVIAVYGSSKTERCSSTNTAIGSPTPPTVTGYELSRDGGTTWSAIGLALTYDDTSPPQSHLAASCSATKFDPSRGLVRVSLDTYPIIVAGSPASYRVRALTSLGSGPSSEPVSGEAGIGSIISYQWQRSASDSDSDYTDLPGVTGAVWVDTDVPLDTKRFYRVVMTTAGASGISDVASVDTYKVRSISVGLSHSCALLSNGNAACWGDNYWGKARAPLDRFASISAGDSHTCGILTNGVLNCWGDSASYFVSPIPDSVQSVSSGAFHTCVILKPDQRVYCGGNNEAGQSSPPSGAFLSVASGGRHTCGIRVNGDISCWGDNKFSQSPELVTGPFRRVSSGDYHSCAVRDSGDVMCWGQNFHGEAPSQLIPGPFRDVSAKTQFTCGVLETGNVKCWGLNGFGQAPPVPSNDPLQPPLASDTFESVATGGNHSCGLLQNGRVRCWGWNGVGRAPPLPPTGNFLSVSNGERHTCALDVDGHVSCFSDIASNLLFPTNGAVFQSVSAGTSYSCGVDATNNAICWGQENTWGQSSPPVREQFKSITASETHTCGIRTDDTVRCWGMDTAVSEVGEPETGGQVSNVPPVRFKSLALGSSHSCGITLADGTVRCWGNNNLGQAPDVVSNGPFVSISASGHHNCGVNTRGELHCWGHESFANLAEPTKSGSYTAVAIGVDHGCVIRAVDQRVECWGSNHAGEVPTTPTLDSFRSIASGTLNMCGVRVDGKILCWGNNDDRAAPSPGLFQTQ